jgi:hypothetical protein
MKPLFTERQLQEASSREALPIECLHCGKTFLLRKDQVQRNRNPNQQKSTGDFCSAKCANEHRDPPLEVTCSQCQKPFRKRPSQAARSPRHFCGCSCAALYKNAHKTTGTRVSKLETWLQTQLPALYPVLEFQFNRRDTINGELDIYVPSLRLAFELNGVFHYEPIYGPEKLASIQTNDERKFQACVERERGWLFI